MVNDLDKSNTIKLMNKNSNQEKIQNEINKLSQKKRKDLSSKERLRLLQLKLYQKAKQEKGYKFYVLYDKIFLDFILTEAYRQAKANDGSPGIDKLSFKDIEKQGEDKFLEGLKEELRKQEYKPQAVKRVWIDKENGGKRPLGIPTIKDRVAQTACKLIIEPIFEADFDEQSYGFRPKRSSKNAIREIKENLKKGNNKVYDADLSKYFDTIPHEKLQITLEERISDPRVLRLINLWLKAPIVEEDGTYTGGKKNKVGTPQGGVISPLLANIYMNIVDRIVNHPEGYYAYLGIKLIRYADDFILMAKDIKQVTIDRLHSTLSRMELVINKDKSKMVNAKEASFDFLGFTFRYDRSILFKDKRFWNVIPKKKSEQKIRKKIDAKLKSIGHYRPADVVKELNPIIRGWMNYYKIDNVSYTQVPFRKLNDYLRRRLYRYYNRKSQRKTSLYGQKAYELLTQKFGLIQPYKSSGIRPVNAKR